MRITRTAGRLKAIRRATPAGEYRGANREIRKRRNRKTKTVMTMRTPGSTMARGRAQVNGVYRTKIMTTNFRIYQALLTGMTGRGRTSQGGFTAEWSADGPAVGFELKEGETWDEAESLRAWGEVDHVIEEVRDYSVFVPKGMPNLQTIHRFDIAGHIDDHSSGLLPPGIVVLRSTSVRFEGKIVNQVYPARVELVTATNGQPVPMQLGGENPRDFASDHDLLGELIPEEFPGRDR